MSLKPSFIAEKKGDNQSIFEITKQLNYPASNTMPSKTTTLSLKEISLKKKWKESTVSLSFMAF